MTTETITEEEAIKRLNALSVELNTAQTEIQKKKMHMLKIIKKLTPLKDTLVDNVITKLQNENKQLKEQLVAAGTTTPAAPVAEPVAAAAVEPVTPAPAPVAAPVVAEPAKPPVRENNVRA